MKKRVIGVLGAAALLSSVSFAATPEKLDLATELQAISSTPAASYVHSAGQDEVIIAMLVEMKRQTELQTQLLLETKKTNALLSEMLGEEGGSLTAK